MAGFIEKRKKWCIRLGNLQKDRFVERRVYTSLRERYQAPVKVVRRLEVLNHRDFINQSVAYVYLHEGNDNLLEELAFKLNGIEFELNTNYIRRLSARVVEAKEFPYNHRNLKPHQGATVKVTMFQGKVTAIEDEQLFERASETLNNNNNNYDEEDDRTEEEFREEYESEEDESDNKQLVSSQPQETPTTSSLPKQQPTSPETPTTIAGVIVHPTPPKSQPTKAENIADRVERLEKEMAELKRQLNRNNSNKSPEFFFK
jgi:hypothetical protein